MATSKSAWMLALANPEDETITGTGDFDFLRGNAGNDRLFGRGGDDVLDGGSGDDYLGGGAGRDRVVFGDDVGGPAATHGVIVNLSSDRLRNLDVPGIEATEVAAQSAVDNYGGTDTLREIEDATGTSFADYIVGSGIRNRLEGGGGDDQIFGLAGNDSLDGGSGDDLIEGGTGSDSLTGDAGNDILMGGDDADNLFGREGNDQLFGGKGNDHLRGNAGDDVLTGGPGQDTFFDNEGAERFDFNSVSETGASFETSDLIFFLGSEDTIDLETIDADTTRVGNQAFAFIAAPTTSFSGTAGELIWYQLDLPDTGEDDNEFTIVAVDVDGDATVDFQIRSFDLLTLTSDQFIL